MELSINFPVKPHTVTLISSRYKDGIFYVQVSIQPFAEWPQTFYASYELDVNAYLELLSVARKHKKFDYENAQHEKQMSRNGMLRPTIGAYHDWFVINESDDPYDELMMEYFNAFYPQSEKLRCKLFDFHYKNEKRLLQHLSFYGYRY